MINSSLRRFAFDTLVKYDKSDGDENTLLKVGKPLSPFLI